VLAGCELNIMRVRSVVVFGACAALLLTGLRSADAKSSRDELGAVLAKRAKGAPQFKVGFAKQLLDPDPADIAAGTVHLGGFGLFPTRASTGPMILPDGQPDHLYARAAAVINSEGKAVLFAGIENQGTFAAYKQCACGITDMRAQVAKDKGIAPESIIINADHSHSGPDLIGLWGGVPIRYLELVRDRTVKALEQAYDNAKPAFLLNGSSTPVMPTAADGGYVPGTATTGEPLVHSQFQVDTATGHDDSLVDTELRVLQAVTPKGELLGSLINYSAHADVAGSSNLGYSGDWPAWVSRKAEVALGEPVAVTMVADVGRSQPPRPNSDALCNSPGHPGCEADKLDTYSRIMLPFVTQAVTDAKPVGSSAIENREVFTREMATNPALLASSYSGGVPVSGYGAYRAQTPPYLVGDMLGTFVSAHRIGDLLFTAAPGEAYPDIRFGVQRSVKGYSASFAFGLANDQVGYLIAPTSEYPWITTSNPGNDNSLFNVSATYGDHVTCSQTAAAEAIGFGATGETSPYGADANPPACPAYSVSDSVPMGPAPQQPWPFGDGYTLPGQVPSP
jgi:hypothetical protein